MQGRRQKTEFIEGSLPERLGTKGVLLITLQLAGLSKTSGGFRYLPWIFLESEQEFRANNSTHFF